LANLQFRMIPKMADAGRIAMGQHQRIPTTDAGMCTEEIKVCC